MAETNHIKATNGYEFHKQLALFSFAGFIDHGFGVVGLYQKDYRQNPDGSVEADLQYIPYSRNSDRLPPQVADMVDDYDPKTEFILSIEDNAGAATVVTLKGEKMGFTPESVWRAAMKQAGKVAFVPGQVVELQEPAADVPPGWYVFQKQQGGWLILAKAGMDDDEGDLLAADETVKLHVDFAELLRSTGINVRDEG